VRLKIEKIFSKNEQLALEMQKGLWVCVIRNRHVARISEMSDFVSFLRDMTIYLYKGMKYSLKRGEIFINILLSAKLR